MTLNCPVVNYVCVCVCVCVCVSACVCVLLCVRVRADCFAPHSGLCREGSKFNISNFRPSMQRFQLHLCQGSASHPIRSFAEKDPSHS